MVIYWIASALSRLAMTQNFTLVACTTFFAMTDLVSNLAVFTQKF